MTSPHTLFLTVLFTTLCLAPSAFASQGNGGERGGRPVRLFLGCQSEPGDPCQTQVEVSALVGEAPSAYISRDCSGKRKINISGAPVRLSPADLSKKPSTPLVYSGSGFRIAASFVDLPDLEHPTQTTLAGRVDIREGNQIETQAITCTAVPDKSQVILPTFHRDHITALRIIKKAGEQPYQAELEVSYYRHCGESHLHLKLTPMLEGNETHCDEHGNCSGSTGTLVGIQAEALALSENACQGADTLETLRAPLGEMVAFRALPPNGLDGLALIPLQPQE